MIPNFFKTESETIKKMEKFRNWEASKPKRHTLNDNDDDDDDDNADDDALMVIIIIIMIIIMIMKSIWKGLCPPLQRPVVISDDLGISPPPLLSHYIMRSQSQFFFAQQIITKYMKINQLQKCLPCLPCLSPFASPIVQEPSKNASLCCTCGLI